LETLKNQLHQKNKAIDVLNHQNIELEKKNDLEKQKNMDLKNKYDEIVIANKENKKILEE